MSQNPPIVMQCGAHATRVGFAGDGLPLFTFPSILAWRTDLDGKLTDRDIQVTERFLITELNNDHDVAGMNPEYTFPFKDPADFRLMDLYWRSMFYRGLKIDPAEQPIVFLYDTARGQDYLRKCGENLFESFNIPGLLLVNAQLAAFHAASSPRNALIVDIGHQATTCVPIVDSRPSRTKGATSNVAGNTYARSGSAWEDDVVARSAHGMVQDPCKFLEDIRKEWREFPADASGVRKALDSLLRVGKGMQPSVADLAKQVLDSYPPALARDLGSNVLVCGAAAQLPGLDRALETRLRQNSPREYASKIKVTVLQNPATVHWIGGSRMAVDPVILRSMVTNQDYRENGVNAIVIADDP